MDLMDDFILLPETDVYESKDFREMCTELSTLTSYHESMELMLEELNDPVAQHKTGTQQALKNTRELTGMALKTANQYMDAEADLFNVLAKMTLKAISLSGKVFQFLLGKATDLIKGIDKLGHKVGQIPADVRAKIKGDIRLYVTAGDIKMIYNNSFVSYIDNYLVQLDALAQGDYFSSLFNKKDIVVDGKTFKSNDMKMMKELKAINAKLGMVTLEPTTVKMDNDENRQIYFSTEAKISFTDLKGKAHNCSYYEALEILLQDLTSRKEELKRLQKEFNAKIDRATVNQTFAALNPSQRQLINDTMQSINSTSGVIGNLMKYITVDVKTMDSTINKILEKYRK